LGISYIEWLYRIRKQVFQRIVHTQDLGIDFTSAAVNSLKEKYPMYTFQWDPFVIPFR
jgi:hypothetical protein